MSEKTFNLRFPLGSTHLVVGPSASGKTCRIAKILKHKDVLIEGGPQIKNIVYCYATWQPEYDRLKEDKIVTKWINKMPSVDEFIKAVDEYKDEGGSILVIDDFMGSINKDLDEIIRVTSRHYNVCTFILFQSLFPIHKLARQISLNVKFIHLHKNPRENAQIHYLARQLNPVSYKWIVQAYYDITEEPYSCMLIDLTQERESYLRYRSHYLPEELPMRVYVEKGSMYSI